MATVTDVEVANASFPTVRQDLNNILEAVATNFSADTEPTTTYANQWWYETDTDKLYIRNEANDAWIHVLTLDQTGNTVSEVQGAGGGDNIAEGNSSVEVIDTGTGYIQFNVDGAEIARIDSDGMKFGDNEKAIFGAGSELQIYSNGTNAYIQENSGGDLYIWGANVLIENGTGSARYAEFVSGGASKLYHAGSAKLATTSTGVSITGDMTLSSSGAVNSELRSDFAGLQLGTTSGHYLALRTNNSERMRIESGGRVLIGSTSGSNANKFYVEGTQPAINFNLTDASTSFKTLVNLMGAGSFVGSIGVTTSATSYNTSSDYRLKENVVGMTGAIDRIKALKPSQFNFIANPDLTVDGFIAHEVQDIVPEAITGEKDAMRTEEYEISPALGEIYVSATEDADEQIISSDVERPETLEEDQQWRETTPAVMGEREVPDYQGIDQAKLVPLLTGALQEAIAKIEALETRIAALEA